MTSPKHSKVVAKPIEDPEPETLPSEPEILPRKPLPSVGRIVHYTYTAQCAAAIITSVNSETSVNLTIFLDAGQSINRAHVQLGDGEGKWHWPEIL